MWRVISEREEIKNYPAGTKVSIDGQESIIKNHYDLDDLGFDLEDVVCKPGGRKSYVFTHSDWNRCLVEVWIEPEEKSTDSEKSGVWRRVNFEELKDFPAGTKVLIKGIYTEISESDKNGSAVVRDTLPDGSNVLCPSDFSKWTVDVLVLKGQPKETTLVNTLFDEEYPDYTTAVTREVLIDFVETKVDCDHTGFIEKLLEVLTHEQCQELVKVIFHLEGLNNDN